MTIIKLDLNPIGCKEVTNKHKTQLSEHTSTEQGNHCYYQDKTLGLTIGDWDSVGGLALATSQAIDQFIIIIEGTAEIKNNKTGEVEIVSAENSLVIPQGYDYQWQQSDYLRKFYLIYEPPMQDIPATPVCEHVIRIDDQHAMPWQATSDGFKKKLLYQSKNHKFTSGVWQGSSFKTGSITFPYNEFIYIKQGCLMCIDEQGLAHKINAGEALFVPQGAQCSWHSETSITLHFVQIKQ